VEFAADQHKDENGELEAFEIDELEEVDRWQDRRDDRRDRR
jgi:hypothetical protein